MKRSWKKPIVSALAAALLLGSAPAVVSLADYEPTPTGIEASVSKKTVVKGKKFELRVKLTPYDADDDDVIWTIEKGTSVIRFADYDRSDDEMEFRALKKGTAKVSCSIKGTDKKVTFTVKVKNPSKNSVSKNSITRVGKKTRTVGLYDDFELKVRRAPGIRERDLTWTIKTPELVRFDDDDRYDDEMEFQPLATGTAKITCKHEKTGKTVTFKVKIVKNGSYNDWDDD